MGVINQWIQSLGKTCTCYKNIQKIQWHFDIRNTVEKDIGIRAMIRNSKIRRGQCRGPDDASSLAPMVLEVLVSCARKALAGRTTESCGCWVLHPTELELWSLWVCEQGQSS
jgi:hypothetical protein